MIIKRLIKKIIPHRLYFKLKQEKQKALERREWKRIKRTFRSVTNGPAAIPGAEVWNSSQILSRLLFADETYPYIRNSPIYTFQPANDQTLDSNVYSVTSDRFRIDHGALIIDAKRRKDNWNLFLLKNIGLRNYAFSFDVTPFSEFEELQIAFRYQDLGNRHRFMVRNNEDIVFETVRDALFYLDLWKKPLKLEMKKKYTFQLIVQESVYSYYLNGEQLYCIEAKDQPFDGDDLALIFWNRSDARDVRCEVENFSLRILEESRA